ncbi:hypothetical protein ACVINW_004046 [Bradyrhizobium sp. USDA 4461]
MGCGSFLNESGRRGLTISPFLKVFYGFGTKQSPKLALRELLRIKRMLFWVDEEREIRTIVSLSVKLVMQLFFQPLKLV